MPELPEVETVMRGLTPVMRGGVIARADVNRPDLRFPLPPDMAARLTDARILGLTRRAKYILIDLECPGTAPETLLIHLGMSGRVRIENAQTGAFFHDIAPSEKHDHVVLHLGSGARITYNDARRFGAMDLCATSDVASHPWLRHLGPEPLGNGFNAVDFAAAIRHRKPPIKTVLLDQKLVAGLGNIYVCESLFDAGISPTRPALSLSKDEVSRLIAAIRDTLIAAIEAGGSSLKDHRQVDGQLGYFQHGFKAYGRPGEPCKNPTCDGEIERITQAGRSTFHCPKCQR